MSQELLFGPGGATRSGLPLFVYGTLRAGEPQAGLLGDCPREAATLRGALYRLPAGYPAVQLCGEGRVQGELCHGVQPAQYAVLDLYEGVPEGLYERVRVHVSVGLRSVAAECYVMADPKARGGSLMRSGVWRAAVRR